MVQLLYSFCDLGRQCGFVEERFEFRRLKANQRLFIDRGGLYVDRYVNPDWTGPPGKRQMSCFLEMISNGIRIGYGHGIFRQRLHNRNDVQFLNPPLPHPQRCAVSREHPVRPFNLSREKEAGGGVEPCPREAGDRIRSAGSGCNHGYTEVIRRLRVILRGYGAGLLVMIADELNFSAPAERVVEMHGAAARNQKYMFHSEIGDKTDDVVREFHRVSDCRG